MAITGKHITEVRKKSHKKSRKAGSKTDQNATSSKETFTSGDYKKVGSRRNSGF